MAGIVFFKTTNLKSIVKFYLEKTKSQVWLDQGKCIILRNDNFLFGFCEGDEADTAGIITFFYQSPLEVDKKYSRLKKIALNTPTVNQKFNIYHFFVRDPEGRKIEFQCFNHDLNPYQSLDTALVVRRSIRNFHSDEIGEELLKNIFELCRYSPTARNSQGYYFVVIKNIDIIEKLSQIREGASKPIGNAPVAVAVCVDKEKTKRFYEDGSIAAYHFILAAHQYGLGTCWIADMDRDEVKSLLNIPQDDFVACITPLGYPAEERIVPERRSAAEFTKNIY